MNNKTINEIFDETKQKMNGHTMLFYFHLSNLCITADPMALLSATVKIEGQDLNLEDVASVSIPNDKQFSVLPKDKDYLVPITKAIKLEHPEFKLEEKEEKDDYYGLFGAKCQALRKRNQPCGNQSLGRAGQGIHLVGL
jgi:ribosome recycling factor